MGLYYILSNCKRFYGFHDVYNNDIVFCTDMSKIHKLYFNQSGNNGYEIYLFDYSPYYNNPDTEFIIKETSPSIYSMAIQQNLDYTYFNRSEIMLIKFNSNMYTNSCLSLSKEEPSSPLDPISLENDTISVKSLYYPVLTPKFSTVTSSSLYDKSKQVNDYYFVDATKCIWPKFYLSLINCKFPLPSFLLKNSYNINVGTINKADVILTPFEDCQNARFVISTVLVNNKLVPDWLRIDQENQNIIPLILLDYNNKIL